MFRATMRAPGFDSMINRRPNEVMGAELVTIGISGKRHAADRGRGLKSPANSVRLDLINPSRGAGGSGPAWLPEPARCRWAYLAGLASPRAGGPHRSCDMGSVPARPDTRRR